MEYSIEVIFPFNLCANLDSIDTRRILSLGGICSNFIRNRDIALFSPRTACYCIEISYSSFTMPLHQLEGYCCCGLGFIWLRSPIPVYRGCRGELASRLYYSNNTNDRKPKHALLFHRTRFSRMRRILYHYWSS